MEENKKIGGFEVLTADQIAQQQEQPVVETTEESPSVETTEAPLVEETPGVTDEPVVEQSTEPVTVTDDAVLAYINQQRGSDFSSIEDIFKEPETVEQSAVPEYMQPLVDFIEETGRSFDDYILFQQLDPEKMDEMSAIKVKMALDYEGLSEEDINTLIQDKYKLDENEYTEDEIKKSKVLLKVDAAKARKEIGEFREKYSKPIEKPEEEPSVTESPSVIDDTWLQTMESNMDEIDGLEFDLGGEKSFTFTTDDNLRNQTKGDLYNIESYFDRYVDQNGSWDMDALSADITLINNIDVIAKSIYKQGVSDGMKGVVTEAANVTTPGQKPATEDPNRQPSVAEQLAAQGVLRGQTLTFNV